MKELKYEKWDKQELKNFFGTHTVKKVSNINYEMNQKGIPIILKAEYNTETSELNKEQKILFDSLIEQVNLWASSATLPNHLIQYKDTRAYQKSILLDWFLKNQADKTL